MFEQNNKTIALNILFVPYNTEQIRLAYKSKYNDKHNNKVFLLMISDGKKWHYFVVKSFSALFRGYHIKSYQRFLLFKLFTFIQNKRETQKTRKSM